MHTERGVWKCHACGASGNLYQLLERLGRLDLWPGRREPYIRKDLSRCGGSYREIEQHLRAVNDLVAQGYAKVEIVNVIMDTFGLSRATAWRRVGVFTGSTPVRVGLVRAYRVLKQINQSYREHLIALRRSWRRNPIQPQEENLRQILRRPRIVTAQDMTQRARAALNAPQPPPEVVAYLTEHKIDYDAWVRWPGSVLTAAREDVWLSAAA